MARIYATNVELNVDYGVDFINGAAAVPDSDVETVKWFRNKGFTVVAGVNVLQPWDYLTIEQLRMFAPYAAINITGKTKAQLVAAIEVALATLMKIEITEFDAIADVAAGVEGDALADAAAVRAILPTTVYATFANGTVAAVPVTAWVDTDTYSKAAAGSYTFTATLGTLPTPFANTAAVTATVEVVVAEA